MDAARPENGPSPLHVASLKRRFRA